MSSSPPLSSASHAQLASLLSASYRDIDELRKELSSTRKRLDKTERLLAAQSSPTASSPASALIADLERAERARDEADARRRILSESWAELDRYLSVIELRAADARAGFSRIVAEGGGQLVLAPIPVPGQQSQGANPPAIMLVPPAGSVAASGNRRPLDDAGYLAAQPPQKRRRGEYEAHVAGSNSSRALPRRPHSNRPHSANSRSSSRSSARSLSIDEMLLEATTTTGTDDRPQSPRAVLSHQQQHLHGGNNVHTNSVHSTVHSNSVHSIHASSHTSLVDHPHPGPLTQPGELRTYQTHIFAPPVTGAPPKKSKGASCFVVTRVSLYPDTPT
ncbi:hypothetical protein BV22DRAFT_602589 [Leucogyrophana mollusca]|uniref:Uncharacterized protein n=1 Tax=Leucogyrophana mollusca TaxID=85980 RepID=A0ACB8BBI7_9AGAM|nr:hypothetical protein BV22DRAFT_602589 [Leucogyrophana mollusca]